MLFYVSYWLKPYIFAFNVVHYLSFRCIAALLTSLITSIVFGAWFLNHVAPRLRSRVRPWTPQAHQAKDYTPTMGGLFIIASVLVNCLMWCNLGSMFVWGALSALVLFGALGAWDDWGKISNHEGISVRVKFGAQIISGLIVVALLHAAGGASTIAVPFFKHINPDIGLLYGLWALFIIVATSNAVNLTDGLDGLATTTLIPNFTIFAGMCYVTGNILTAQYLNLPYIPCAELAVVSSALVGSCLGFLWYNSYPAQMFMGDVGSLSLGAVLAFIALSSKQELLLPLAGGLFVVETLSVIVQIVSFKLTGKRMFKMAPIHHHFELLGWPEAKITLRFGIISLILCLLALITIKIR